MSRGRSSELIMKRNEALLRRYYYWTEIQRLRFDDALKILSEKEFFISVDRIMAIIRSNCNRLKDIDVKPVPKIKKPRLTAAQLSLLPTDRIIPHGTFIVCLIDLYPLGIVWNLLLFLTSGVWQHSGLYICRSASTSFIRSILPAALSAVPLV